MSCLVAAVSNRAGGWPSGARTGWPTSAGPDDSCPIEVRSLGGTILRWKAQIAAWHQAHVTNAPTEAASNLIKRVKRIAFGFTRFRNPDPRAALRRSAQLGTPRHRHTPLKSQEPAKLDDRPLVTVTDHVTLEAPLAVTA